MIWYLKCSRKCCKEIRKDPQIAKRDGYKWLAKTNIRKQVGGSLLTSILSLGRVLGPTIRKILGLSTLARLASEGASQIVKKVAANQKMSSTEW